jgi:hypothetical protein
MTGSHSSGTRRLKTRGSFRMPVLSAADLLSIVRTVAVVVVLLALLAVVTFGLALHYGKAELTIGIGTVVINLLLVVLNQLFDWYKRATTA